MWSYHIKRLVTLTDDYIKRHSRYFVAVHILSKWPVSSMRLNTWPKKSLEIKGEAFSSRPGLSKGKHYPTLSTLKLQRYFLQDFQHFIWVFVFRSHSNNTWHFLVYLIVPPISCVIWWHWHGPPGSLPALPCDVTAFLRLQTAQNEKNVNGSKGQKSHVTL